MSGPCLEPLAALLDQAVVQGVCPAAQACVIHRGGVVHESAHGAGAPGEPASCASVFDLASVTKAAATTAALAVLLARGSLTLATPLARVLPELAARALGPLSVRELLAHTSGLAAWEPLFLAAMADPVAREIFGPARVRSGVGFARARQVVLERAWAAAPGPDRGRRVYSDLGFIALGRLVERSAGTSLDRFCREAVFAPLGLADLGFVDLATDERQWISGRHVLPTGRTRPREPAPGQERDYAVPEQPAQPDPGAVDDDNAYAMGGVAGHAGLFGTARALARLGWLLWEEIEGAGRLGAGATLAELCRPDQEGRGPERALGFDRPAPEQSLTGRLLGRLGPRGAVGHWGFTGCSLWVDLDRQISIALCTNRTLPGRHRPEGVRALRPALHDAAIELLS